MEVVNALKLITFIGQDGKLILDLPENWRNHDAEVVVIMQSAIEVVEQVDENGWPIGYFEETFGSLAGLNFKRPDQGEYEIRDERE